MILVTAALACSLLFNISGAVLGGYSGKKGITSKATLFSLIPLLLMMLTNRFSYFSPMPSMAHFFPSKYSHFYLKAFYGNELVFNWNNPVIFTFLNVLIYGSIFLYLFWRSTAFYKKRPLNKAVSALFIFILFTFEIIVSRELKFSRELMLIISLIITVMIIPKRLDIRKFYMRKERGEGKLSWISEDSPSFPFVIIIAGITLLTATLNHFPAGGANFPGVTGYLIYVLLALTFIAMTLFLSLSIEYSRIRFNKHPDIPVYVILFGWWFVLPLFAVFLGSTFDMRDIAVYFGSLSPVYPLFFASGTVIRGLDSLIMYVIGFSITAFATFLMYYLRVNSVETIMKDEKGIGKDPL
jgi:hypothetical protein